MRQAEHAYTIPVLNEAQRRRFGALQAEIERTLHEMTATLQRGIALLDAIDAPRTDLEPEEDAGIEDAEREFDLGEGDAELGWANEGRQTRLHGSRDDAEPTLGATGGSEGSHHLVGWRMPTPRSSDECEDGGDDELTGDENEPSLGSLDRQSQTRSYRHSPVSWGSPDLEGDGDGREADLEPSLGSLCGTEGTQSGTQLGWAGGHDKDAEEEHDGREEELGL